MSEDGSEGQLGPQENRVRKWESHTETPLVVLALLFLAAYAWPILNPGIPLVAQQVCSDIQVGTWLIFVLDYLLRLGLSVDRRRFVRRHLFDLAIVSLPILRPLRALRLLMLLRIFNRSATSNLRGRVVVYVTGGVFMITVIAALAILDAERDDPAANIATFGDALWWAITTVTTVGYGDHFPVTTEGRFVAVGLMVSGIALLGTITASLASWFSQRVRAEEAATDALGERVNELTRQIDVLTQALTRHETLATAIPTAPSTTAQDEASGLISGRAGANHL